jgi:hypothetical protein
LLVISLVNHPAVGDPITAMSLKEIQFNEATQQFRDSIRATASELTLSKAIERDNPSKEGRLGTELLQVERNRRYHSCEKHEFTDC